MTSIWLLFGIALGLILYVYCGYPLLLWFLVRRSSRATDCSTALTQNHLNHPKQGLVIPSSNPHGKTSGNPDPSTLPKVSLLIPAYNEEQVIAGKIENALALDYPEQRLEIWVASDASTDQTDRIIAHYNDPRLFFQRLPKRHGKTATLNHLIPMAQGDILVFTDANALFKSDALLELVRGFGNRQVGCVCGRLVYTNQCTTAISAGESLYWSYENWLKGMESTYNSLIVANGAIFAIRRELYPRLDNDLSDDAGIPLLIHTRGYRVVYRPEAIAYEEAPLSIRTELRKKTRWITQQWVTLARLWSCIRAAHNQRLMWQLFSHKILRWGLPFFLFMLFVSSALLVTNAYARLAFLVQFGFYGLALVGLVVYQINPHLRLLMVPLYFCTVNLAAILGTIRFLRGQSYTIWDKA